MYKDATVERMIQEKGKCLPMTIPGAYTLIYFNEQDSALCGDCATTQAKDIISVRTYDEGPNIECSDCGLHLESSYGDPENV